MQVLALILYFLPLHLRVAVLAPDMLHLLVTESLVGLVVALGGQVVAIPAALEILQAHLQVKVVTAVTLEEDKEVLLVVAALVP
jgi:hypothetical protein